MNNKNIVLSVFMCAGSLAFGLIFLNMVIHGFTEGKIYYAAGQKPIKFRENPFKFIFNMLITLILSITMLAGACVIMREIWNRL